MLDSALYTLMKNQSTDGKNPLTHVLTTVRLGDTINSCYNVSIKLDRLNVGPMDIVDWMDLAS